MTLYGTGVRRTELTRLKVSDIDSRRMVMHIQGGKGRQDRDVMPSPMLLEELRAHWRRFRKKSVWLFPGNSWHSGDHPIDDKTPYRACVEAAPCAGIKERGIARSVRPLRGNAGSRHVGVNCCSRLTSTSSSPCRRNWLPWPFRTGH
jgi:integrase